MTYDTQAEAAQEYIISKNFKCPKCGGDVKVFDTMFCKTWECINPDCDYKDNDF